MRTPDAFYNTFTDNIYWKLRGQFDSDLFRNALLFYFFGSNCLVFLPFGRGLRNEETATSFLINSPYTDAFSVQKRNYVNH